MTAKEQQREAALFLSRYQVAKNEVKDIQRRIERVRSEMMSIKGISYEDGDMPKAHNMEHDLSDYIVRIDDLIKDWEAAQERAITVMREVSATIEAVDHDQARRVLMLHFIDNHTYEDIAKMVPCDLSTVYRWKRIGFRKIACKCH